MSAAVRTCSRMCLVDVATNLTDSVFHGVDWTGKRVHEDDFDLVLQRAADAGVGHIIITGTNLIQCEQAIRLCRQYPDKRIVCTVGVHPAHSCEFARPFDRDRVQTLAANPLAHFMPHQNTSEPPVTPEEEDTNAAARLEYLVELVEKNRDVVVAVGEIGIDYAELSYCPREVQEKYFLKQLRRFHSLGLPFVFHSRDCGMRFVELLEGEHAISSKIAAVVHSFNGSSEEQEKLLNLGYYLSVNGSAFREEQLAKQVLRVPLSRLMLETDAPWCDVRSKDFGYPFVRSHFPTTRRKKTFVMGTCLERRNEPCHLVQVLEVFAGVRARFETEMALSPATKDAIAATLHENAVSFFGL